MTFKYLPILTLAGLCLLFAGCRKESGSPSVQNSPENIETLKRRLSLRDETEPRTNGTTSRGTFSVFENRTARKGRMIRLSVVILHAIHPRPLADPVFVIAGGPGYDVTDRESTYVDSWIRNMRDVVLVSLRGSGGNNRLDCRGTGRDDDLQSYLDSMLDGEAFRSCLDDLRHKYDLSQYSTFQAVDDLNEVRRALGYSLINIFADSWGTRTALVYMKRHTESVRCAVFDAVAPTAFRNPLYHSPSAQSALELLFAECANDPACSAAYPQLQDKFQAVLERLEDSPVDVTISHPVSQKRVQVRLNREAFAVALRTMLYYLPSNRQVPYLIHRAFEGDFEPFAQMGVESNRRVRRTLALGLLACVTCTEDVTRIDPGEINSVTGNSFLKDTRIREQMAICDFWPRTKVPDDFGDPISIDVPILMFSGSQDPVIPPQWGEEAARHLPNSLHLIIPGAHRVAGLCVDSLRQQFLENPSIHNLDISCTETIQMSPFRTPRSERSPD
ncbi:MAG: alpha/beta hydrolase [Candidatus Aminicenantes bacterium]|nr:alpha/beta hydrolase [Candidatus Aminicenantes bacterium]